MMPAKDGNLTALFRITSDALQSEGSTYRQKVQCSLYRWQTLHTC